MLARAASRSTASTKSRCSTSRTNVIASPLFWQPKQCQTPLLGTDRERRRLLLVERAQARRSGARRASARRARSPARRDRSPPAPARRRRRECPSRCRLGARVEAHTPRGRSSGRHPSSSTPETERVPVGHAADVAHGDRGRLERAGREVGVHAGGRGRQPGAARRRRSRRGPRSSPMTFSACRRAAGRR